MSGKTPYHSNPKDLGWALHQILVAHDDGAAGVAARGQTALKKPTGNDRLAKFVAAPARHSQLYQAGGSSELAVVVVAEGPHRTIRIQNDGMAKTASSWVGVGKCVEN